MKVRVRNHRGFQLIDLDEYLTPSTGGYDSGGAVEQARQLAEQNAKAIGFILARMVDMRQITFKEAESAAGQYNGEAVVNEC